MFCWPRVRVLVDVVAGSILGDVAKALQGFLPPTAKVRMDVEGRCVGWDVTDFGVVI
jgi:hypothetical protein